MSACQAKGRERCSCTYIDCDKRGNCCQCVAFHKMRGEFTACFFSVSAEHSYDRSFAALVRDRGLL